jgi:hypothetical protein
MGKKAAKTAKEKVISGIAWTCIVLGVVAAG